MKSAAELSRLIRQRADQLKFDAIGIAPAVTPPGYHRFLEWLSAGHAADMVWLEKHREARSSPGGVMPGTTSVVMVALNYYEGTQHAAGPRVSRYAWGRTDYHELMRSRLQQLAATIHEECPDARTRIAVDTAPLLERDFARLSGIGWIGKNTMLISRRLGSWFFLGAILTDVLLAADQPHETDHCGSCSRCLEACPTDAFPEPYVLDASRCISYLTIEQRQSPIPRDLRPGIGPWLFGCDVCQDVCPWNRFAPLITDALLHPQLTANPIDCRVLLRLTEDEFRARFAGTPLLRPRRAGLLRNAAIVLGNLRDQDSLDDLIAAINDPEPLVRGAAAWALSQMPCERGRAGLLERLQLESDPDVRQEIQSSLS